MKKWYESKAVWGGIITVGAAVAGALGIVVDVDTQGQIADLVTLALSAIGGLVAIYGRIKADKLIK